MTIEYETAALKAALLAASTVKHRPHRNPQSGPLR